MPSYTKRSKVARHTTNNAAADITKNRLKCIVLISPRTWRLTERLGRSIGHEFIRYVGVIRIADPQRKETPLA